MKYLKPTDQYDINIFNQNFKEVENIVNASANGDYIRPLDWIWLPDISNETEETVVALVHVPQDGIARVGFTVTIGTSEVIDFSCVVDWGDGVIETINSGAVTHLNAYHQYNYDSIVAEKTVGGDKQIILRIYGFQSPYPVNQIIFPTSISYDGAKTLHMSCIKEIAVQAGRNNDILYISLQSMRDLKSFCGYSIYRFNGSLLPDLKRFEVTGTNFKYFTGATIYGLRKLNIPSQNQYTYFNWTNCGSEEVDINAASITQTQSISNAYNLRKLIMRGMRYGVNASYNKMDRSALVEFFKSLGMAVSGATLSISNGLGFSDLTDSDKKIATDKGFTIA